MAMFERAEHVNVYGGSFVANAGSPSKGLDKLIEAVAPNAILNAGGSTDEIQCYPGTREEVIGKLETFMDDNNPGRKRMMWLSGPAGAGKSAIFQTVAERCSEQERHAANFFFFQEDSTRSHSQPLVATLVYQLRDFYPALDELLSDYLAKDPLICNTPIKKQFKQLISSPIQKIQQSTPIQQQIIIIIDGLDECNNERAQEQILVALHALAYANQSPFLILVSSRAEPHLVMCFNRLGSPMESIFLNDDYQPQKDIRLFVVAKFAQIKKNHYLAQSLSKKWPTDADINTIINKSSGQFTYPAAVMRLIEYSLESPALSLATILAMPPSTNYKGSRSLQQDWLSRPSRSRLYQLPGSSSAILANGHDLALARQSFEGNSSTHGLGPGFSIIAYFSDIGTALQQRLSFMTPMYGSAMSTGQYGMSMNMPAMYHGIGADQGKGKARKVDFEAAFSRFADSQPKTSKIEEVTADVQLGEIVQQGMENVKPDDSAGEPLDHDGIEDSSNNNLSTDDAQWEAELSCWTDDDERDKDEGIKLDSEGIPILGDYVFEQHNKFLDRVSSSSLLNDAKAILEQNGSLSEAALMLEAAIQQGELGEGGYETWILLGETRNMDEREEAGMRALMEGVKRAEANGAAGVGMLSLAISFSNEQYDRGSHAMLLRWFRARFPEAQGLQETIRTMSTTSCSFGKRMQHAQSIIDPDLQIALGVLFYTDGEYERAQDCFSTALRIRPTDFLLWNRLGSSMSNGNKPEEALSAYREALNLRPTYTRAIYNAGVACLNIGADMEAAELFLSALSLQEATDGDTSGQLWLTLRRALLSMKRTDLADLAGQDSKANLDVFRREGFDF